MRKVGMILVILAVALVIHAWDAHMQKQRYELLHPNSKTKDSLIDARVFIFDSTIVERNARAQKRIDSLIEVRAKK